MGELDCFPALEMSRCHMVALPVPIRRHWRACVVGGGRPSAAPFPAGVMSTAGEMMLLNTLVIHGISYCN